MIDLIRYIRSSVNMSQQEFADDLRVAFATVNRWENGKTTPPPAAQKAMFEFCLHHNIDIADYIIRALIQEKIKLQKALDTEIFFHGSKSGLEGEIMPRSRPQCEIGRASCRERVSKSV